MIFSLVLYAFALFLTTLASLLPSWTVWPASLLDGLTYFFQQIGYFNFLFPIDSLFTVMTFIIQFEVAYFIAKLVMKVFNYFRGTGSGLDI